MKAVACALLRELREPLWSEVRVPVTSGAVDEHDAAAAWLAEHHSQWATPKSVLERIVRDAGFTAIATNRIIVGQANEVYGIDTGQDQNLILRLAHRPDHKFFSEAAAIATARAHGVPAPEVLAVDGLLEESGPTAFILERRMPGVMLAEVLTSDSHTTTGALAHLGEILAAIHDIPVQGFGNLSAGLAGTHGNYGSWFIDMFTENHLPETLAAVAEDDEATALVHRAADTMSEHRDLLDTMSPRLAHGDLSPTNVLVDQGRISGIIDWEAVKGAARANDFAWWTTVHPAGARTLAQVLSGYKQVADLDDGFDVVLRLSQLRILTGILGYASRVEDHGLLGRAKAGLRHIVHSPESASAD